MLVVNKNFKTYESDIRALLNSFFPGEGLVFAQESPETAQSSPLSQTLQSFSPGQPAQSSPPGQPAQSSPPDQPAQSSPSGQTVQHSPFGQTAQPSLSGRTVQSSTFSQTAQPSPSDRTIQSCPSGRPVQPSPSGRAAQPSLPDRTAQSSPHGPIAQPSPSDRTIQSCPSDRTAQPSPSGHTAQSPLPGRATHAPAAIDIDIICGGLDRSKDRFTDKSRVKKALYNYLRRLTGRELPWGTLTGIRPVRLIDKYRAEGLDDAAIDNIFANELLISAGKRALLFDISRTEDEALSGLDLGSGCSIYIGIPFCPTRCVYCSFTSYPYDRWEPRAGEYLECIDRELKSISRLMSAYSSANNSCAETSSMGLNFPASAVSSMSGTPEAVKRMNYPAAAEEHFLGNGMQAMDMTSDTPHRASRSLLAGKHIDTIYVGGGTPTALSAPLIDRLLTIVEETLDLSQLKEFTFEAGRPDTIDINKLKVLKRHGITRISINPQSMNQKTLDLIGRRHTTEDIREVFRMARSLGFDNINMDVIAGLPGEDLADFEHTLSEIGHLDPESLTVHTLAVKRASRMNIEGRAWGGLMRMGLDAEGMDEVAAMTALGADYAKGHGLRPYYIYRQKNMAGSQENIGYARPGTENLYNILMMEEKHTVIGVGAGASTKAVAVRLSDTDAAEAGSSGARDIAAAEAGSARVRDIAAAGAGSARVRDIGAAGAGSAGVRDIGAAGAGSAGVRDIAAAGTDSSGVRDIAAAGAGFAGARDIGAAGTGQAVHRTSASCRPVVRRFENVKSIEDYFRRIDGLIIAREEFLEPD